MHEHSFPPSRSIAGLEATRLSDLPAALGESPLWDAAAGRLWWIDGVTGRIHRRGWTHGDIASFETGGHVGAIALASENRLLVMQDHAFLLFDPTLAASEVFHALQDAAPAMRLNDGKLDRQGRCLCAGMGRGGDPIGALHQLDGTGRHRILADGIRIGNGVCFSPDGGTLYFTDTPARQIMACDYDPASGTASAPRLHVDTAPLGSGVDGATVDCDGNIWAAFIHSGDIACLAPSGRLLHRFPAPTDLPSSLCFAGPDLATLVVTSIRDSGTGRAVSQHPEGGHVFALAGTGATGLTEARFTPARPAPDRSTQGVQP
jgi:L-arabinonolactonase